MGWLATLMDAYALHAERQAARKQNPEPIPPATVIRPGMCRRCGCDTASCREYGCIPQDTPQTEDSLTGRRDMVPETRYSHGQKDTR